MRRSLTGSAILLASLLFAHPSYSQQTQVIQTCGTFPRAQALGGAGVIAVDQNGSTCVVGTLSLSGASANNADNVAPVATGLLGAAAYNYVWDGAVWDRLYGDQTNGAFVNVKASVLPADAATQTTLAAVLAKLTADPSTATLQATANTDLGPPGATACATDTGSCSLNALLQRLAQRLTTINTTLGAPAQESSGNLAQLVTDFGAPGATACATDTSSCNANQFLQRLAQRLSTIITTLGAPMQATGGTVTLASPAINTYVGNVNTEGTKTTYSFGTPGLVPNAAGTDFLCINGSGSGKTVRVTRLQLSGIATAASAADVLLIKRSTANTGGGPAAFTLVPNDSNNAAATATATIYTSNPTLGTTVGTVRAAKMTLSTSAGAIPIVPVVLDFTVNNSQGFILRGTAQGLCLNWNTQTITGNSLDVDGQFTEE